MWSLEKDDVFGGCWLCKPGEVFSDNSLWRSQIFIPKMEDFYLFLWSIRSHFCEYLTHGEASSTFKYYHPNDWQTVLYLSFHQTRVFLRYFDLSIKIFALNLQLHIKPPTQEGITSPSYKLLYCRQLEQRSVCRRWGPTQDVWRVLSASLRGGQFAIPSGTLKFRTKTPEGFIWFRGVVKTWR